MTKSTTRYADSHYEERISFLRALRHWIAEHGRANLIMAQRGSDWLAPMLFETSCTRLTVTTWIEKMLLPALRPNSLVIMDNALFHNKPKIAQILVAAGRTLMPLPR